MTFRKVEDFTKELVKRLLSTPVCAVSVFAESSDNIPVILHIWDSPPPKFGSGMG